MIGAFCINFDVEALNQMQQFMDTFLSTQVEAQEKKQHQMMILKMWKK